MHASTDHAGRRSRRTRIAGLAIALALIGLVVTATAVATTRDTRDATPAHPATTLRLITPDRLVRTHETDVPPRGPSPGDEFQATGPLLDASGHTRGDLDLIGTGVFNGGTVLGTATIHGGQIVFAATTSDIDATAYAIVGGTGIYTGASGTVTTSRLPRSRVAATILLTR